MKKITLIICLLLIPNYVKAEVCYEDYQIFENDTYNFYEETEHLKRESKTVYQNIYYEKIDLGYKIIGEDYSDNIIVDLMDKKELLVESYDYKTGAIGPMTTINTNKGKTLKYVRFNNFNAINAVMETVSFFSGENRIYTYIADTNYYLRNTLLPPSYITFDLRDIYSLDDLKIEINFKEITFLNIQFDLSISENLFDYETYTIESVRTSEYEKVIINFSTEKKYKTNYFTFLQDGYKHYEYKKIKTDVYSLVPLEGHQLDYDKKKELYTYYILQEKEIVPEIKTIKLEPEAKITESTISKSLKPIETNIPLIKNKNTKDKTQPIIKYIEKPTEKKVLKNCDAHSNIDKSSKETNSKEKLYLKIIFILLYIIFMLLYFILKKKKKFCRKCLKTSKDSLY